MGFKCVQTCQACYSPHHCVATYMRYILMHYCIEYRYRYNMPKPMQSCLGLLKSWDRACRIVMPHGSAAFRGSIKGRTTQLAAPNSTGTRQHHLPVGIIQQRMRSAFGATSQRDPRAKTPARLKNGEQLAGSREAVSHNARESHC